MLSSLFVVWFVISLSTGLWAIMFVREEDGKFTVSRNAVSQLAGIHAVAIVLLYLWVRCLP
jgi:hypothetical protein